VFSIFSSLLNSFNPPIQSGCTATFTRTDVEPNYVPEYYIEHFPLSGASGYVNIGPLICDPKLSYSSYDEIVGILKKMEPKKVLQNARLSYTVYQQAIAPAGNPFPSFNSTSITQENVSVEKFSKLVQCCNPKNGHSLKNIEQCWSKL